MKVHEWSRGADASGGHTVAVTAGVVDGMETQLPKTALLVATLLAVMLAGCGGGADRAESTGVAPQPVEGAPPGYGPPGGKAGPPPELAPKQ